MPKHVAIDKNSVVTDVSYFPCYCTGFTVQSSVGNYYHWRIRQPQQNLWHFVYLLSCFLKRSRLWKMNTGELLITPRVGTFLASSARHLGRNNGSFDTKVSQFENINTANILHCLPINNRYYFIWQFTALLTQTVSRNNTQRSVRRNIRLPWVGVHAF